MGPELLYALIVGLIGWYLFQRLPLPGGAIVGPMLAVAAGAFVGLPTAIFPFWIKTTLQIIVGIYAGAGITRKTIQDIRAIGGSVALVTGWTVLSAVAIGYLVGMLTRIDLATALLGSTPGGIDVMSAIAMAVGADVAMVAVLQTFRVIATIGLVPIVARRSAMALPSLALSTGKGAIIESDEPRRPSPGSAVFTLERSEGPGLPTRLFSGTNRGGNRVVDLPESAAVPGPLSLWKRASVRFALPSWIPTIVSAACGGLLISALGVQGGAVLGSLFGVAAIGIARNRVAVPPLSLRTATQIGMGVVIGSSVTPDSIPVLVGSLPIVLAITVSTLVSAFALAGFLQRRLKMDACTSMLACAPGGLSQMPLLAAECGADTTQVTVFQLARYLGSVTVLPVLFRLLL